MKLPMSEHRSAVRPIGKKDGPHGARFFTIGLSRFVILYAFQRPKRRLEVVGWDSTPLAMQRVGRSVPMVEIAKHIYSFRTRQPLSVLPSRNAEQKKATERNALPVHIVSVINDEY